jgi:hypothetical protein
MKMTIVLDTDDLDGLKDANKIARMLLNKHGGPRDTFYSRQASFGKIPLIKLLRAFAVDAIAHMEEDPGAELDDIKGLRFTKKFVDARWDELFHERS